MDIELRYKGYATVAEAERLKIARISTLEEYHAAGPGVSNRAGKLIDEGFEGYLLSLDLLDIGMHPFLPIYDVTIERKPDSIGAVTPCGTVFLPCDTMVEWR